MNKRQSYKILYSKTQKGILMSVLLSCLAFTAAAQPYDRIERRNFWNESRNINGLRTDSVTISFAQLHGSYESGDFRDTYMAPEGWSAGASAKTMVHLQKFSMKGAFSFENFSGQRMCGSMSARPGYYPVDILEFTPGNKTRQTYYFDGGITVDVAEDWRIGGNISFMSENYTKRKDLRHTDYLLDMTVTPSVMYHNGDFAIGLGYIFSKNSESITAEVLGISSENYYAFIDKGLMYGVYDLWDSQGLHLNESGINGFPAKELSHGAAVQFQWKNLFAEAEYLHSDGSVGEKQTVWFRFPTDKISARLGYKAGKGELKHYIRLSADFSNRRNFESVMQKETEDGVTINKVYGENQILHCRIFNVRPDYEITASGWEFRTGIRICFQQEQTSQIYPYLAYRQTLTGTGYVSGMVRLWKFDLRAGLAFSCGRMKENMSVADSGISVDGEPYRLGGYNDMHIEYLTAPRISSGISLRFNFWKGLYAEIAGRYSHGFGLQYLDGSGRWRGDIRLGYTF